MKKSCKNCKKQLLCNYFVPFPEVGCSDFVNVIRKRFVLVHLYCETGFHSIVAFSDDYSELEDIAKSQPHYGSSRHVFEIVNNFFSEEGIFLTAIKDKNLINICKNVAEYLSIAEYSMLKKSFIKASSWFEKAKNSAFLGADIIDNY